MPGDNKAPYRRGTFTLTDKEFIVSHILIKDRTTSGRPMGPAEFITASGNVFIEREPTLRGDD